MIDNSMPFFNIIILISVIGIIIFIIYIEPRISKHKIKNKNEHGSSKFADMKEITKTFKQEQLSSLEDAGFPIWFEKKNNHFNTVYFDNTSPHWVLIGSSGSGKSTCIVLPECIMFAKAKNKRSIIVTDPKGEIFSKTSKLFKDNGYNIYTIDFRNPNLSNRINIMQPIINEWKLHCSSNNKLFICMCYLYEKLKIDYDLFVSNESYRNEIKLKNKIDNYIIEYLLNKIDNRIVELTNQEFEQMNANFKNNNDISNVFDYTDTLFKKTKTNDPYWIDLAKETLNYVIIRLLETKDNLNYNTLMEVINNKSEFISICKSATTTIHNPDIIKIVEHIKNATDKMLDSFYSIIKEQFTPNNEMTSYNIKFDNDLCFNISIPKEFDSIKRVNDKTYQIGNGISVITIINARCNSEELLKTRAKEWLANSADTNRQIITDNLDKEYTLKNNQLKVVEKVATKDNKKRYYKFIYYNQTMLIFAYNDSDLSNTVDNIIVSIKAVKNQIKTERDPFANPNQ